MAVGIVGVFSGKGTIAGIFVMADGANVVSEGLAGIKASPLTVFADLANPHINSGEGHFVVPLPCSGDCKGERVQNVGILLVIAYGLYVFVVSIHRILIGNGMVRHVMYDTEV